MCGINGYIDFSGKTRGELKEFVEAMNETMLYRGPDYKAVSLEENVALGHLRLSIIDLSEKGRQPMSYDHGRLEIVFNGEIYNFKDIKKELIEKKYKFQSETDTEVIMAAYKQWGVECVKKLNGMFAFALHDKKKKRIILARDRLGIKPLYWYKDKKKIIFSSEIKGILSAGVEKQINYEALGEYLQFQNTFGEKTFFADINLIEPGTYIEIDLKRKDVKKRTYWDVVFEEQRNGKEFRQIFEEAIKRQLMSDVPVGTYLSGGFDSTSVTVLAAQHNKNMHTFTAAFKEGGVYDERKLSRLVAKRAKAKLHEVVIDANMLIEALPVVVHHLDEPTKLGRSFAQYYVAGLAKKHVTVTLTGHGGDELFAGYPVFLAEKFRQDVKKNPLLFPVVCVKMLRHSSWKNLVYYYFGPWIKKELKYRLISVFDRKELKRLLKKQDKKNINGKTWLKNLKREYPQDNSLQYIMRVYLKTFLPSLFLVEDRMSMAHSIESRVPVCDNELVEFALKQRFDEKLQGNELKWTIKQGMKDVLPEELYTASKKGFPVPLGKWFRNELKGYVSEKLLGKESKIKQLFNQNYIKKIIEDNNNFISEQKVWMLLNIELWMEEHF